MNHLKAQIEEAQRQVSICRRRAEKPGAGIEDEFALEKARNRLLALEVRALKQVATQQSKMLSGQNAPQVQHSKPMNAKERAEAAFAALQKAGS